MVLSHRNFISNVLAQGEVLRIYESDRMLSTLPLHQALEFTGGLLLPLLGGATITYLEAVNSREMLRALRDRDATVLLTAPRLLRVLADRVERLGAEATAALAALRRGRQRRRGPVQTTSSAPMSVSAWRFAKATASAKRPPSWPSMRPIRTEPRRWDRCCPDSKCKSPSRTSARVGEVLVRGTNVMEGYFSQEELTEAVLRDGWLHTGDLGRLDDDGYLFVEGRSKDLIVNGAGHNVYPREVESLYHDLLHVAELSVVGVPSARTGGEEVHGVAVLNCDAEEAEDLREAIQVRSYEISRTLPSHHRIQHLHFWTRPLPKLDDGTVDRRALASAIEREGCPSTGPTGMGAGDPAANRPACGAEHRGGSGSHRRTPRHLVGFADGRRIHRVARAAAGDPKSMDFCSHRTRSAASWRGWRLTCKTGWTGRWSDRPRTGRASCRPSQVPS